MALFLILLASGLCVAQLHAQTCHLAWMVFSTDRPQVSLALSPMVLAKNERESHHLTPVITP